MDLPDLAGRAALAVGWLIGTVGGSMALWDRFSQRVKVRATFGSAYTVGAGGGPGEPTLLIKVINRKSHAVWVNGISFVKKGSKPRGWFMPGPGAGFTYPTEVQAHDARDFPIPRSRLVPEGWDDGTRIIVHLSTGEDYWTRRLPRRS